MMNTNETNIPSELSIAIVDDHEVVLEGLYSFLKKNGQKNVQAFRSARDLLRQAQKQTFDLYIIDIELPDMEGDTLIDAIRTLHAEARIIVNTMHEEVWVVKTMQEKQVDAVIYKSTDLSQLLHAIRAVSQGSKYFCPQFRRDSQRTATPTESPSRREQEVLREIARGLSTKEIAARLYISENTVETHRQSLFAKLQAHNMADLMVKAIAQGYINPHDIASTL
ncbi:MAG: response regulator transcription factor [Bacteroidaceae bacterium]|nr:response regulator transcription factor [Bacteroidaceae bacterium]